MHCVTHHGRPAGIPQLLGCHHGSPSAVSPFGDCLGYRMSCSLMVPSQGGLPIYSAWLTWGYKGLAPSPQLRTVLQGHPSFRALCGVYRGLHRDRITTWQVPVSSLLPSTSFPQVLDARTLPHRPPAVTPISESAFWGPSWGNDIMTILQRKKLNLRKITCQRSENHLFVKPRLRLHICWPPASPSFSLLLQVLLLCRPRTRSHFPQRSPQLSLSGPEALTTCSVWHMAMVSFGDFSSPSAHSV